MKKLDKGFLGKLLRDFFLLFVHFSVGIYHLLFGNARINLLFRSSFITFASLNTLVNKKGIITTKRYGIQFQRNREEMAAAMD